MVSININRKRIKLLITWKIRSNFSAYLRYNKYALYLYCWLTTGSKIGFDLLLVTLIVLHLKTHTGLRTISLALVSKSTISKLSTLNSIFYAYLAYAKCSFVAFLNHSVKSSHFAHQICKSSTLHTATLKCEKPTLYVCYISIEYRSRVELYKKIWFDTRARMWF